MNVKIFLTFTIKGLPPRQIKSDSESPIFFICLSRNIRFVIGRIHLFRNSLNIESVKVGRCNGKAV